MRSRPATFTFTVLLGIVSSLSVFDAAGASAARTPVAHEPSVSSAGIRSDSFHAKPKATQKKTVGSWRNLPSITKSWGSYTAPKIYWEDAGNACCVQGTLKDICPGDGKHVEVLAEVQVNNLEDEAQWVGSTEGHNCGWSSYVSGGEWDHSTVLFQVEAARLKLCRWTQGQASEMTCTGWTSYTDNPFA